MKAIVFHDVGDIRLDEVAEPHLQDPADAIIKISVSALCGTDLHMVRGTLGPMEPGTIVGHEAVGIVEQVGAAVRNVKPGDRVVVPSTIACGYCSYCRAGYYSQCDNANPHGKRAGTAFFGGPRMSGPFHGLQAEKARIPFANTGLVKLPDSISDKQAITLSDIFPTGYFGADLAEITPGDTVAVFGCGPVGLCAVMSAQLMNAGRIFAVDQKQSRLETARSQGAEIIDFSKDDPVQTILELTGGIGADRVIDAVGIDSEGPVSGPAAPYYKNQQHRFEQEKNHVAPNQHPHEHNWFPGNAPSLALQWEVEVLAKAGTLAIIGVYPETLHSFPIGMAMNKNLTITMGNCNHRRYIPELLQLVMSGAVNPEKFITHTMPLASALEAYHSFDVRDPGWIKVEIIPEMNR